MFALGELTFQSKHNESHFLQRYFGQRFLNCASEMIQKAYQHYYSQLMSTADYHRKQLRLNLENLHCELYIKKHHCADVYGGC